MIACGAVRDELERALGGFGLIAQTSFLDPDLHFDYRALEKALQDSLEAAARVGRPVVLVYGACFPGIDALAARYGAVRVQASNCLSMLLGEERYVRELAEGAFFLAPHWLSSWRLVFERRFGLDAALARELFAELACRVVYLEVEEVRQETAQADEFSRYVGLPLQRLKVSLQHLGLLVEEAMARAGGQAPNG